MSLAEQKLSDLKKRYIWSRENLPSFDFEHFLVREVSPFVFTDKSLNPHITSILFWDTKKFETEAFQELFSVFLPTQIIQNLSRRNMLSPALTEILRYWKEIFCTGWIS